MAKVYLHIDADGGLRIAHIPNDGRVDFWKAKILFIQSQTTDETTKFDPDIHTLEAIAAGIEGHRPLAFVAEIDHTELPSDRYFRNAWEWSDS